MGISFGEGASDSIYQKFAWASGEIGTLQTLLDQNIELEQDLSNAEDVNNTIQKFPITIEGKRIQFIEKKSGDVEGNEVVTGLMLESGDAEDKKLYIVKVFEVNGQKY